MRLATLIICVGLIMGLAYKFNNPWIATAGFLGLIGGFMADDLLRSAE